MVVNTHEDGNPQKRQKRERKLKKEKTPSPNQCEHFLQKKNRRCAMQRKKNERFCSEHILVEAPPLGEKPENDKDARVPCPLDPKHTVKQRDLSVHLQKCNARPAEIHDPWYVKDMNAMLNQATQEENEGSVSELAESLDETEIYTKLFSVLEQYTKKVPELERKVQTHAGLDEWLQKKENQKHLLQQSSLVAAMQEAGLLSNKKFYVEFGCGKAELSRTVNACVVFDYKKITQQETVSKQNYGYGLIDRGVNRMKMDNKIISDCEGTALDPQIKRSRIDIQHLALDEFMASMPEATSLVAISKHLCGAATDLSLKLIMNAVKSRELLDGMVVAMCCRHVCDYDQLLPQSRKYLTQHDVKDASEFGVLKKIVSWAVCGKREGQEDNHASGYNYEERERLGLVARRLIDDSRVYAINELMPGHVAELFLYADKTSTLENHCLRLRRKTST